VVERH